MRSMLWLWLLVLLDMFAVGLVVPLLPYYTTRLGADAVTFGYLGSLYGILQLIGNPISKFSTFHRNTANVQFSGPIERQVRESAIA